ncbi:hypothetical protein EVAR_81035_1 [Eumeta japonica]|uniref:Uncharacterized protein n=1 Tax=Eumeta variegata TaxID=151549 RepID=A0A4C1T6D0_EUMVA|nr:hypothetical protein EVAR_81035_1 [Eumeta japonica]
MAQNRNSGGEGESQMTYWFTRYKFKFTEVDYSLFLAYSALVGSVEPHNALVTPLKLRVSVASSDRPLSRDSRARLCPGNATNKENRKILQQFSIILKYCRIKTAVCYLYGRYIAAFDGTTERHFAHSHLGVASTAFSYAVTASSARSFITIYLFSKRWNIEDSVIGVIACASRVCASVLYALAPSRPAYFLGPALDMFSSAAATSLRSIASKLVEEDEIVCTKTFVADSVDDSWQTLIRTGLVYGGLEFRQDSKFEMKEIKKKTMRLGEGCSDLPGARCRSVCAGDNARNDRLPLCFGKVSSLISISEALVPVVYSPVYSRVYLTTLGGFAGAFYLISAALAAPAVAIFM